MRLLSKFVRPMIFAALAASLFVTGCGDSKRNSQGTSLSFVGWFFEVQPDDFRTVTSCRVPLGDNGNFSVCESSVGTTGLGGNELAGESGDLALLAGLVNHLRGQGVRLDRVHHTYIVPGGKIGVPDTTIPVGMFLGPSGDIDEDFNSDSSLPDTFEPGDNDPDTFPITPIHYLGAQLITNDIRTFLVFNRAQFPEPPYQMIIRSFFSGITTSGSRIESNDIDFGITWTPDVVIQPTPADTGAQTGSQDDGLDELEGLDLGDES